MESVGGYRPVAFTKVHISVDRRHARANVADEHVRHVSVGHFPGDPFAPGAYVADWMVALAHILIRAGSLEPGPCRIERCVFVRRIQPGAPVFVEAELDESEAGVVRGRVQSGGQWASRAVIRFNKA